MQREGIMQEQKVIEASQQSAIKGKKGFRKGISGCPTGRPKGIHDAKLLKKTVKERLESLNFDPILTLVEIARDVTVDIGIRRLAAKDLLDKTYPSLKAVDVSGEVAQNFSLNIVKSFEKIENIIEVKK